MARVEKAKAIAPGTAADTVAALMDIKYMPDYNHEDPAEVEQQTHDFFEKCISEDLVPGLESYASALHITREELEMWLRGGDRRGDVVREAYQFIKAVTEQMGMKGFIAPSTMIFLQKNNFGYSDEPHKLVEEKSQFSELPGKEDIMARLPKPLDFEKKKRGRPKKQLPKPEGDE